MTCAAFPLFRVSDKVMVLVVDAKTEILVGVVKALKV